MAAATTPTVKADDGKTTLNETPKIQAINPDATTSATPVMRIQIRLLAVFTVSMHAPFSPKDSSADSEPHAPVYTICREPD